MSSPSWTMPSPVSGPPIMSREFLRRAKRVKAAANPDQATAQTVEIMCQHIHASAKDPLISRYALEAVRQWRGGAQFASTGQNALSDPLAIAESIWWWCKHTMTFVHHSKQILVWFGERDQFKLLIEPSVLVRMNAMEGDCAIYSMLICSMLEAWGSTGSLETLATNPGQPDIYNHVFLRVVLPNGRRIPFDCRHGKYLDGAFRKTTFFVHRCGMNPAPRFRMLRSIRAWGPTCRIPIPGGSQAMRARTGYDRHDRYDAAADRHAAFRLHAL